VYSTTGCSRPAGRAPRKAVRSRHCSRISCWIELDCELERRGHCFVRYADDCNVYVRSEKAGHRVTASLTRFIEGRLKLQVNTQKSAVARPCLRSFLARRNSTTPRYELRQISVSATITCRSHLGDRRLEQHFVVRNGRREGVGQCDAGSVRLLVHELAADPVSGRQIADCRRPTPVPLEAGSF
jgi:hypothetical protein